MTALLTAAAPRPKLAERRQVLEESQRQPVVRLIFVLYLLLVFEGALRKWVLPGYQQYLYF